MWRRLRGRAGLRIAWMAAALVAAPAATTLASPSAVETRARAAAILDVPGGSEGLAQVLGISPGASCARTLLTAIRVMWQAPPAQDRAAARRVRDTREYLEAVAAFERARAAFGQAPASLASAGDPTASAAVRALADALGGVAHRGEHAWQITLDRAPTAARRRRWLAAAGLAADELVARLNARQAVALRLRGGVAPLPFGPELWRRVLKPPEALRGSPFASILGDRRAALLYLGAVALDADTQAFVADVPALADLLYTDLAAATFALCGRSLHVKGGRLVLPGGDDAAGLWEAVVGASAGDAPGFTAWLFSRDEGRVALLHDAIAHLDGAALRFALGLDEPDAARRRGQFVELARIAAVPLAGWDPRTRPFERVAFDVAHLLTRMRMAGNGRPSGPLSDRFWRAAFAGDDIPAAGRFDALGEGPDLDAAGLLGMITVANTATRRGRAEAWMFAQRVFPSPAPTDLPDILIAVRGMARFRALVLTLERMGISDPLTYASAVRAAASLSQVDRGRAWTPLAQFQGALAVVERARFARAIDAVGADRLVRTLCAVPLLGGSEYLGGVAAWIDRDLLPVFASVTGAVRAAVGDGSDEARVLAIMAGAVPSSPYGDPSLMPKIEWEGLHYRIDPAGAAFRRMAEVRRRQGGLSLDAVLGLARATADIGAVTPPGQIAARVEALARAGDGMRRAGQPDLDAILRDVRRRLLDRPEADDLARAVRPLHRAIDWHLARVLASLAYAPHLGEADGPALLGGDPSAAHDFDLGEGRGAVRTAAMWSLPQERRDRAGWRVSGALLGLDLAMSRFALRRMPSEVMPEAPMLSDIERLAFTEPVVLASPFDHSDAAGDALVAALRRGRARAAAAASSPEDLLRLAGEAGLDEWRAALLPWLMAHEPARLTDEWSLGEFVRLGAQDRDARFDAWGVSGASGDGNLTVEFPWRLPWTTLAGRKGSRQVAALVPDLPIALAEALADRQLPARLSAGVLSVATQDLLDTLRVSHDDDWLALVTQARNVAAGRLDDYVAALTIGGPLVPIEMEHAHATDR